MEMMSVMGSIMTGHDLREARERLTYTQAELAARLGVTQNTISRWELGMVTIQHQTILALALEALEALEARARNRR